jgi:hypothetical protein
MTVPFVPPTNSTHDGTQLVPPTTSTHDGAVQLVGGTKSLGGWHQIAPKSLECNQVQSDTVSDSTLMTYASPGSVIRSKRQEVEVIAAMKRWATLLGWPSAAV